MVAKYLRSKDFQASMHLMQNTNLASIFINYLVSTMFYFTQLSFHIKADLYLVSIFFITRPVNCFHAENAHFSVHLTREEGFIAFLNISLRPV